MKTKTYLLAFVITFSNIQLIAQQRSYNGYSHTPQGHIHVLIIFAQINTDTVPSTDWPLNSLPVWANDLVDTTIATIGSKNNLSKLFYDISSNASNPFLVTGKVFSKLVKINSYSNTEVFNAINSDPDFVNYDWGEFDKRDNYPLFQFDNSMQNANGTAASGDKEIDYITIIYRNLSGNSGFASIGNFNVTTTINGFPETYTANAGHTHNRITGDLNSVIDVWLGEFLHTFYNGPHHGGENNVCGAYFYMSVGWGISSLFQTPFLSNNAWESWWLNWITPQEINSNTTAVLSDFVSNGDAIRIPIPNTTNQYLWIENHQKKNSFIDGKINFANLATSAPGLYMYIVRGGADRNNIDVQGVSNPVTTNFIKFLNAEGNFDYQFKGNITVPGVGTQALFQKVAENPIAGQNDFSGIRWDYDTSGTITLILDGNGAAGNEHALVWAELIGGNTVNTYGVSGNADDAFIVGDEVGLSGIVPVLNYPTYNNANPDIGLEPFILNGLSVKALFQNANGDFALDIKFDDYEVRSNKRWCGNINLPPSTLPAPANYSVNIMPGVTVTIDKSGTPNRHTKTAAGDFINPTTFTMLPNSYFHLEPYSTLIIDNGSTLIIQQNAELQVHEYSQVIVKNGGKLIVEDGALLAVQHLGLVHIQSGGELILQNTTAGVDLVNTGDGFFSKQKYLLTSLLFI